jgi:hypothetical protein
MKIVASEVTGECLNRADGLMITITTDGEDDEVAVAFGDDEGCAMSWLIANTLLDFNAVLRIVTLVAYWKQIGYPDQGEDIEIEARMGKVDG